VNFNPTLSVLRKFLAPLWAAGGCWLAAAALTGQVAPAAKPAEVPAVTGPGEAVQLSPFTVNTDKDTGFAASSSLAGGRLATDLRDTPASYSVITREFIEALNITDLMGAQEWTPSSTYQADTGANNFFTFTTRFSVRGVAAGQPQRNFFPVNSDSDSFDLERYDFGRGANSILFGNGSVGGVSSSSSKRARTDRSFQEVRVTVGSWSAKRATVDVNQRLNAKIALRAAALWQDGDGWRLKEFEKRKGLFLTSTYKPFRNTEIRLEAEAFDREFNKSINNLSDQLLGWDGKTTFAAAAALNSASTATLNALQAAGVSRRGANYNVYDPYNGFDGIASYQNDPITLGGGANPTTPIGGFTYINAGNVSFNTSGANLLEALNVPGNRFDLAEAGSGFRRPSDRFSLNADGPLLVSRFRDVQLTINQQLGDFFFEVAGDLNKNSNFVNGEQNRGSGATYIDINRTLPNGAPNKHFLEAYGDANYFRGYRQYDYQNARIALAYKKDTRFGNYTFNVSGGINQNHYTLSYQWLSLAQGTNTLAWINGTTANIKVRRYWNESSRPITDLSQRTLPYHNPNTGVTEMVKPRWVIDHTRFDSETINDSNYTYGLAALNAKFWRNKLVLIGAVRRDYYDTGSQQMAVTGDYPTDRDPLNPLFKPKAPGDYASFTYRPLDAAGNPLAAIPAVTRPRISGARDPRYTQYRFQDDYNAPNLQGYVTTKSVGSVFHLNDWISPSVNYGESFNPQRAYNLLLGGALIPPNVSESWDYGLRFGFLQRRLSVNLTHYRSQETNNSFTISGFPFNAIWQAMPIGSTTSLNNRSVPTSRGTFDVQKRLAEGYEIEITANPIKGLRVTANAGLPKVYSTDFSPLTRAYVAANTANLRLVAQDAGVQIDVDNVASVNPTIPADQQSADAPGVANAYNTIFTSLKNLRTGKVLQQEQPTVKFFADYTFQSGRIKGLRFGGGVQYRAKEIVAYRGADTIVNPANPATAIDDPDRDGTTPVYTPKGDYTATATLGYSWKLWNRPLQANLVISNLLNDRSIIYAGQNGGAAVTAQRPRGGDYRSPAREAYPVAFGLKEPIKFSLSFTVKM
jgi:outer membrane receptor protein involved in Fe transport